MMQKEEGAGSSWRILGPASILSFAMWASMFCVPPMEHILKEELFITHAQASLLYTTPTIMVIAVGIPAGIIADRIGVRKATGIGVIILAVGAVLRGTADSYSSLMAFTFIYGAGVGWCYPQFPKMISTWIPREKFGTATGIYTAMMTVGVALALAITMSSIFPITNTFQGVFFIWSIPTAVAAVLWWVLIKEPRDSSAHAESVMKDSISFRQVLQNKNLWLVTAILLLEDFFFFTWTGWAPKLMMLKGATADLAGIMASVTTWVAIPTLLLMPRLSYKLGVRKPFIWGPSILLAIVAWGAIHASLFLSWALMALVGVADLTRYVILLVLPIEMMRKDEVGRASGLLLSVGSVGGIIGPLIGGSILDLTGSFDLALLVLTGISIASAGITFRLPETGFKAKTRE